METMRSFGYICPHCGKAVLGSRSVFALQAAAARVSCACGESELTVETDGLRYRVGVPCGVCGETHTAELSGEAVLQGRGVGLACPENGQLCCFVGEEDEVKKRMEELAIRCAKEKGESPEAFSDNVIMYEVLSELKDIAARGGIACSCGSKNYALRVNRGSVDITCKACGGTLRIPAATDNDLDALCARMKLELRGR